MRRISREWELFAAQNLIRSSKAKVSNRYGPKKAHVTQSGPALQYKVISCRGCASFLPVNAVFNAWGEGGSASAVFRMVSRGIVLGLWVMGISATYPRLPAVGRGERMGGQAVLCTRAVSYTHLTLPTKA